MIIMQSRIDQPLIAMMEHEEAASGSSEPCSPGSGRMARERITKYPQDAYGTEPERLWVRCPAYEE